MKIHWAAVLFLFLKGSAGDVNPRKYKDIHQPHDSEPMGERLGLDVLKVWRKIKMKNSSVLDITRESLTLSLVDADNFNQRIEKNQSS